MARLLDRDVLSQFSGCFVKDQDAIVIGYHSVPVVADGQRLRPRAVRQLDLIGQGGRSVR